MSLHEPRCMVCGAPLPKESPFKSDFRGSEVCSDKCYKVAMYDGLEDEIDRLTKEVERLWGLLSAGNEIDIQRVNQIESLKDRIDACDTEIFALRATVASLTKDRDQWRDKYDKLFWENDRLTKEVETETESIEAHKAMTEIWMENYQYMQAKVARYEEALDDICRQRLSDEIWTRDEQEYIDSDWQGAYDEIIKVARTARHGQG